MTQLARVRSPCIAAVFPAPPFRSPEMAPLEKYPVAKPLGPENRPPPTANLLLFRNAPGPSRKLPAISATSPENSAARHGTDAVHRDTDAALYGTGFRFFPPPVFLAVLFLSYPGCFLMLNLLKKCPK